MKSRQEIIKAISTTPSYWNHINLDTGESSQVDNGAMSQERAILEVLLDIRDLLQANPELLPATND